MANLAAADYNLYMLFKLSVYICVYTCISKPSAHVVHSMHWLHNIHSYMHTYSICYGLKSILHGTSAIHNQCHCTLHTYASTCKHANVARIMLYSCLQTIHGQRWLSFGSVVQWINGFDTYVCLSHSAVWGHNNVIQWYLHTYLKACPIPICTPWADKWSGHSTQPIRPATLQVRLHENTILRSPVRLPALPIPVCVSNMLNIYIYIYR